jgi:hypothetical protein
MIISHSHKYVFIQLPRTGSTAIGRELIKNYEGGRMLKKHSTYYDFLKQATPEEKRYFVFSCIRNPLDDAVSAYFKYRTNHLNRFTDAKFIRRNRGIVGRIDNQIYRFIHMHDADFPTFFMRYYRIPYNNWASLSHKRFNAIIRFEHLADDFAKAIHMMGIELKRPLPLVNKTDQRARDFTTYYTSETIARAKRVFGPFMRQWGYRFPPEWGEPQVSRWNQLEFRFYNLFRSFYWKHLRYRI